MVAHSSIKFETTAIESRLISKFVSTSAHYLLSLSILSMDQSSSQRLVSSSYIEDPCDHSVPLWRGLERSGGRAASSHQKVPGLKPPGPWSR